MNAFVAKSLDRIGLYPLRFVEGNCKKSLGIKLGCWFCFVFGKRFFILTFDRGISCCCPNPLLNNWSLIGNISFWIGCCCPNLLLNNWLLAVNISFWIGCCLNAFACKYADKSWLGISIGDLVNGRRSIFCFLKYE